MHAVFATTPFPTPSVIWRRDNGILSSSSRINITTTQRDSVLAIADVMSSDSGVYTIAAASSAGQDQVNFMLIVRGKSAALNNTNCCLMHTFIINDPAQGGRIPLAPYVLLPTLNRPSAIISQAKHFDPPSRSLLDVTPVSASFSSFLSCDC